MNSPDRHHKRYRVCGLHIRSAVAFPELRAEPDLTFDTDACVEFELGGDVPRLGSASVVMTWDEPPGTTWLTCTKSSCGFRFNYPGYADFLVDRFGRQVRCVAMPETAPDTIRHLFLDQVIPLLLNLRGREALHASAIQAPEGACAFIGASGGGKSTLAAAFHAVGYPVLSDDCLLLKDDVDCVKVEPAYAGLRLWDDSRSVLLGSEQSTLPVSQYTSKRRVATPESNAGADGCLPLRGIYLLRRNNAREPLTPPLIESISMRDAFMGLVEYSFRLDLTDRAMILRQMQVLERVVREVPVRRLRLPHDFGHLPAAREMILQDLKKG